MARDDAPAAEPARLVVLHDADCGFCLAAARLLRRWDRRGLLDLVPLQVAGNDPRPAVRRTGTRRALRRELHAVDEADEAIVVGGDAVLAIAARLPGGRVPAAVLGVPPFRWAVAAGYTLVAANRHRIGWLLGLEGPGCLVDPGVPAFRAADPGRAVVQTRPAAADPGRAGRVLIRRGHHPGWVVGQD